MSGVRLMRRGVAGVVTVGVLVSLGPAATAAAAKPFVYKVTEAQRDVIDIGKLTTTSAVKWDGEGHRHDTMQPPDEELPPLPLPVFPNKKSTVGAATDVITDGAEDSFDAEGNKQECSGTWEGEDDGFVSVEINDKGKKLVSSWEIPHGLATENCGLVYDQFPYQYMVKGTVSGDIGDPKLVLKTKGEKEESEAIPNGVWTQTLKWEGKMVLKRVKQQFG